MVNFTKSIIYFGADTDKQILSEMAAVFGMNSTRDTIKYLSLPSIWGRSKSEASNFLKERIMNKVLGWRLKLLNNGGKEVLIKTVITSIPTYAMSVFQLPITWCKGINAIIARFWWGTLNRDIKIH